MQRKDYANYSRAPHATTFYIERKRVDCDPGDPMDPRIGGTGVVLWTPAHCWHPKFCQTWRWWGENTWSHHHPGGLLQCRYLTRFPGASTMHRTDPKQERQGSSTTYRCSRRSQAVSSRGYWGPEPSSTSQWSVSSTDSSRKGSWDREYHVIISTFGLLPLCCLDWSTPKRLAQQSLLLFYFIFLSKQAHQLNWRSVFTQWLF